MMGGVPTGPTDTAALPTTTLFPLDDTTHREPPRILTTPGVRGFVADRTPKQKASNTIATHFTAMETARHVNTLQGQFDSHIASCKKHHRERDELEREEQAFQREQREKEQVLQRKRSKLLEKQLNERVDGVQADLGAYKKSNNARVDGIDNRVDGLDDRVRQLESASKASNNASNIDDLRLAVLDAPTQAGIRAFADRVFTSARVGKALPDDLDRCLAFDCIAVSVQDLRLFLGRGYHCSNLLIKFVRSMNVAHSQGIDTKADMQCYLPAVLANLSAYAMVEDSKNCRVPFASPQDVKGTKQPRVTKTLASKLFKRLEVLKFDEHPNFACHHSGRKTNKIKVTREGDKISDSQDRLCDYLSENYDKKW